MTKFNFLIPVNNIELDQQINISFDGGRFCTNADDAVSSINKAILAGLLGFYFFQYHIMNQRFFICIESPVSDKLNPQITLHSMNAQSKIISMGLWLIRDNSIFSIDSFALGPNGDFFYDRQSTMFSKADGTYGSTKYSQQELQSAIEKTGTLVDFLTFKSTNERVVENNVIKGGANYMDHSKTNRITRSLLFISTARSNSFLPAKISSYMSGFEALFTTDNSEVTHKVAQNVANYIGLNTKDKKEIFFNIKSAYSLRSRYVHGDNPYEKKKGHAYFAECSAIIDQYMRRTIEKVLSNDRSIFLSDKESLRSFFIDLSFT